MFLVVDRNNVTGIYSVLDTEDGVVDKFNVKDLLSLVKEQGINIHGLVPNYSRLYTNYGVDYDYVLFRLSYNSYCDEFHFITEFNKVKMYGNFEIPNFGNRFSYCSNALDLYMNLNNDKLTSLTKLIFYAHTIQSYFKCSKSGVTDLIIKVLYNWRISKSGEYSVSVNLNSSQGKLSFEYNLPMQNVEIVEYNNSIYFVDSLMVIEIPKSSFDKLYTLDRAGVKLKTLKRVSTTQTAQGNLKVGKGDSLTVRGDEGYKYILGQFTELNELIIRGSSTKVQRLGNRKLNFDYLECDSSSALSILQSKDGVHADTLILDISCLPIIDVVHCTFNKLKLINNTNYTLTVNDYGYLLRFIKYNTCYTRPYKSLMIINERLADLGLKQFNLFDNPVEFNIKYVLESLTTVYSPEFLNDLLSDLHRFTILNLLSSYLRPVVQKYTGRIFSETGQGELLFEESTLRQVSYENHSEIEHYIDMIFALWQYRNNHIGQVRFDCTSDVYSSKFVIECENGMISSYRLTKPDSLERALEHLGIQLV